MDDAALLKFYLEAHGPDASPWNLSPCSLYLEYRTRQYLVDHFALRPGTAVCNVGIGAGYWDSFLTYWIGRNGSLTSIDIDRAICDTYDYRQKREGNPNPTRVVCADIRNPPLARCSFDLVTIIGVEPPSQHDYAAFLDGAFSLVSTGGRLFYWEKEKRHSLSEFRHYMGSTGRVIEMLETDDRFTTYPFYMAMARPSG